MNNVTWWFRTSSILWGIWGAVHIFAGVMTLAFLFSGETAEAVHGIASKIELAELQQAEYPAAVSAILSQHGFNLLWFGAVTALASPLVWRGKEFAVLIASLVGGLADSGYFLFIDLGDI